MDLYTCVVVQYIHNLQVLVHLRASLGLGLSHQLLPPKPLEREVNVFPIPQTLSPLSTCHPVLPWVPALFKGTLPFVGTEETLLSVASSKHLLIPSAGSNLSFLQPPHFPLDTFTHTTLFFGYFPLSTFNFCYIFTFYLSYMCLNSLRAGSGLETSFYSPII